jgi:hypothetical protein
LIAFTALLMAYYRQSKPRTAGFLTTLLAVVETCRQQRRNAFAFLTRAVEAHLAHQPAPSLLPGA